MIKQSFREMYAKASNRQKDFIKALTFIRLSMSKGVSPETQKDLIMGALEVYRKDSISTFLTDLLKIDDEIDKVDIALLAMKLVNESETQTEHLANISRLAIEQSEKSNAANS